jgi:hypothetical protein
MSFATSQDTWQQVAEHLSPFQIAMSWGSFVVVQCIAVKVAFLLTILLGHWVLFQEFFILTKFKTMERVLDHVLPF